MVLTLLKSNEEECCRISRIHLSVNLFDSLKLWYVVCLITMSEHSESKKIRMEKYFVSENKKVIAGIYNDKSSAEEAYFSLRSCGYAIGEINVLITRTSCAGATTGDLSIQTVATVPNLVIRCP